MAEALTLPPPIARKPVEPLTLDDRVQTMEDLLTAIDQATTQRAREELEAAVQLILLL